MKKSPVILTLLALACLAALTAYAGVSNCVVVSTENNRVVINCKDAAHKIKAGEQVTLKPSAKRGETFGGGC